MAYKTVVSKACATREVALTELWSTLSGIGWTLVDGAITPSTFSYTAVDTTNNWCTVSGHNYLSGTPVQLQTTGTAPGGLAVLTQYYVVNPTTDTFKLATTYNGSAIDITTQGTGNHTIAESYRVYSSNGENSDKISEFIQINFWAAATTITIRGWYKWNVSTHTGSAGTVATYIGTITTNQTGFTLWIYGNKNIVAVFTKISATYYKFLFGHFKAFTTLQTTLTQPATSGSSVTVDVTSTVGFESGYTYQIVGSNLEGRDNVVITSITNSTQMIITTLPRNYSSGSFIGLHPSTFGTSGTLYFCLTCAYGSAGLTDCNGFSTFTTPFIIATNLDPEVRTNKYVLQPILISTEYEQAQSLVGIGGYIDEYILISPNVGLTIEDTFSVNRNDSGTSTGTGNTSTVIYDTAKTWTTNAYSGKVIIISFGTGIGQIKKIASNTDTSLTLASGWIFETIPDATSQYIICDEGYRYLTDSSYYGYLACREGY